MSADVGCSGITSPPCKRRRISSSDEEDLKRPRYYYILAPESTDEESASGTESICSLQGQTTDLAKDTSDTSSDSSVVEFEVVSPSEDYDIYPLPSKDSSPSSPSDITECEPWPLVFSDSEICDGSSDTNDNQQVSRRRLYLFTNCVRCNAKNELPFYRYCRRCYKVRKNFFPPRPKGRKKRSSLERQKSHSEVDRDTGVVSGSSALSISLGKDISESELKDRLSSPVEIAQDEENLCSTCLMRPKDGGFLHKKIVHVFSCYKCSDKIIKQIGRCPVCNLKVNKVCKVMTI